MNRGNEPILRMSGGRGFQSWGSKWLKTQLLDGSKVGERHTEVEDVRERYRVAIWRTFD